MPVTFEELIEIVEGAAFIDERLEGMFTEGDHILPGDAGQYMKKWNDIISKDDETAIHRRLALDGVQAEFVSLFLKKPCLSDTGKLPEWAGMLQRLSMKLDNPVAGIADCCFLDPKKPLAFQEIFVPLIEAARDELKHQAKDSYRLASGSVQAAFERSLLSCICTLCYTTLLHEYSVFCIPLAAHGKGLTDFTYYRDFVENTKKIPLFTLLKKYPVLARLVATSIQHWVNWLTEFLTRFEADREEISRVFLSGEPIGKIAQVTPDLSDKHNEGRMVISLTLDSGFKLIYKPRSLAVEEAYFDMLSWFNTLGISLEFKTLKVLSRKDYGWVEFAQHTPCADIEGVGRYYRRAGNLLCLLYLCGAVDCHFENIIACGEYPVFIDVETLLQPQVRSFKEEAYRQRADFAAAADIAESIVRTGFVPFLLFDQDQRPYDVSGLAGPWPPQEKRGNPANGQCLTGGKNPSFKPNFNMPVCHSRKIPPFQFGDIIIKGFQEVYTHILANQEQFISVHGPFEKLRNCRFRFVFRASRIYNMLFSKLLKPSLMGDAVMFCIESEALMRIAFKKDARQECLWPLVKSEVKSLLKQDIPYFTGNSTGLFLDLPDGGRIEGFFAGTAHQKILLALNSMSERRMEKQCAFIRACLHAVDVTDGAIPAARVVLKPPVPMEDMVKRHAYRIGEKLEETAYFSGGAERAWISFQATMTRELYKLQPAGCDLYYGLGGIALFAAALSKVYGDKHFEAMALSAIRIVSEDVHNGTYLQHAGKIGMGGITGVGSVIYSLLTLGEMLGKGEFYEHARTAAAFVTDSLIQSDKHLDVVSGVAGAVLALSKLYRYISEDWILDAAIKCGRHIVNSRVKSPWGYHAWPTIDTLMPAGFSHGAAGISYALTRLYALTGEKIFLDVAGDAVLYEAELYRGEDSGWLDVRKPEDTPLQERRPSTWCHGAAGICLARIGSMDILRHQQVQIDIEHALTAIIKAGPLQLDHLCCGNAGVIDTLTVVSERLNRPELFQYARSLALYVLERAEENKRFSLRPKPEAFHPGLFSGSAGVIYSLLRLQYPGILPCILLLE